VISQSPLFLDCLQGTKDWFNARLGCSTSSRIASIVAKRKRGGDAELACRAEMRWELICELLTGSPSEHYVSRWMQEGKDKEPLARSYYEIRNDVTVDEIGFAYHPTVKFAGASPDGIIGEQGLLEIKCPRMYTHLEYIAKDAIPEQYLPQMIWQLACCPDYEYNDFVSFYCPMPEEDERFATDLPEGLRFFQKRLYRTQEVSDLIAAYEIEVEKFNAEVQEQLAILKARIG
jgi:putative phage-type endonuclease